MKTYKDHVHTVLQENLKTLTAVNPEQVQQLIKEIQQAKTIQLYGMGRMQLSVRGFAMRLKHMGFDSYVVYDTTTPCIGNGDLLIVHCAVTNVELNVIQLAKKVGARIVLLTAHPENEHGQYADLCVHIPGQIFGINSEIHSVQPMSTLLEQSLFLFTDIITMMLMEQCNISLEKMKNQHTNLEGLSGDFA
ncbi:SIS domain-containing protein [Commensalibacter nepenthis]|uniref:SIS domain-containing protein n=1 Tax=Commensalibacter nepenthis TaxID=3043872 RepID=A0ABT6Q757_9PROT|nr:SIS domain-containing protein [Commensalibacter sp. TBRC 10068]MDI2112722.1 SIS domain-containing protein [Commensalibacter sp. TBRC 10068]